MWYQNHAITKTKTERLIAHRELFISLLYGGIFFTLKDGQRKN